MSNFSFKKFVLRSICFLAIQQGITANTNDCKTPKLKPTESLVITVFDKGDQLVNKFDIWNSLCDLKEAFPSGLVKIEYKTGSLAAGKGNDIKCGSGDCKEDKLQECLSMNNEMQTCSYTPKVNFPGIYKCYCSKKINQTLLDNAALRKSWKIPDKAVPTLAVNQTYDPCITFGSYQDIFNYVCQVYGNKVGHCGKT